MAKQPEIVPWSEDLGVTWTVEQCIDGRYAYLTLRDTKGRLVRIPGTHEEFASEAYIHMNRIQCQMLANYLNSLIEGR